MAKIYNNGITTTAGFKFDANLPLDDRLVVETFDDLSSLPCYEGMIVYVKNDTKHYKYCNSSWSVLADLNIENGAAEGSILVGAGSCANQSKNSLVGGYSNKLLKDEVKDIGGSNNIVYGASNTVVATGSIVAGTNNIVGDIDGSRTGTANRGKNVAIFGAANELQNSEYSFESGYGNKIVNSKYSGALGANNTIDGKEYTNLLGNYLTATRNYQTIVGANNDQTDTDSIFAVAWDSKNRFTVNESGDAGINGNLNVEKDISTSKVSATSVNATSIVADTLKVTSVKSDLILDGTVKTKYLQVSSNMTAGNLTVNGDVAVKGTAVSYNTPTSDYHVVNKRHVNKLTEKVKELEGKVTVVTFNIPEANNTITLQNLTGVTEINWGDGTFNSELNHEYKAKGVYTCKIQDAKGIGESAFIDCSSLTSVTIGDSVTSIGDGAFAECWSLTSVTIGNGVTSIGHDAFDYCSSLTALTFMSPEVKITNIEFLENCTALTHIYVPYGCGQAYKEAWSSFAEKIVESDKEAMMSDVDAFKSEFSEEITPITDEEIDDMWNIAPGTNPGFSMTAWYVPVWNGITFENGILAENIPDKNYINSKIAEISNEVKTDYTKVEDFETLQGTVDVLSDNVGFLIGNHTSIICSTEDIGVGANLNNGTVYLVYEE